MIVLAGRTLVDRYAPPYGYWARSNPYHGTHAG
jgi:hypothetical protein